MKKFGGIILGLICFLLLFASITTIIYPYSKPKIYYSIFKNPNLNYSWDFNSSLLCGGVPCGGYTYNLSYFQLKKFSLFEILVSEIINHETTYIIPYEIQYKHEEGHIFTSKLLNITSPINGIYEYRDKQFALANLTDSGLYNNYSQSVSEGIADYYAINYFNNTLSETYAWQIDKNKNRDWEWLKHYLGLKFVNASLTTSVYRNLSDLILDFGSKRQYDSYQRFINTTK